MVAACAFESAPLLQFDLDVWFAPAEGHTKQEACKVLCDHTYSHRAAEKLGHFRGADRALEWADKPGQAGGVCRHTSSHYHLTSVDSFPKRTKHNRTSTTCFLSSGH